MRDGTWTQTLVVDSMQVYKEIPNITNQQRDRVAGLVGVASVKDDWSMAQHRDASDKVLENTEGVFVLDAGTGMYLNGIIMDIDIYPRVPGQAREKAVAEAKSSGSENPRRTARERELELAGYERSGSIWSSSLRYDASIFYLRPDLTSLDSAIEQRSKKISRHGIEEAEHLVEMEKQGIQVNPSVGASIGVRELRDVVYGACSIEEAETRISARTRKLARRQIRWFDKLTRTLCDDVRITVASRRGDLSPLESVIG